MKRTLRTGALFALVLATALSTGCGSKILEDIGSDPHPPTVAVLALKHFVPPPPVATADGKIITWDSGGFSVAQGGKFEIEVSYADAGGDITKVVLKDRDGVINQNFTPTGQTYFSGTSGTFIGPEAGVEITGIAGAHRLQLWAEDSHESRSEPVEFVVTLVY